MDVGQGKIKVTAERDPAKLPHGDLGVDIALECTGIFTARDKAALHLQAGARTVLTSGPSGDADLTMVYGVNHDQLPAEHMVVANASCNTNCIDLKRAVQGKGESVQEEPGCGGIVNKKKKTIIQN